MFENARIDHKPTPEGRIGAAAVQAGRDFVDHMRRDIDYADMEDAIRPYVRREILRARIEEIELTLTHVDAIGRIKTLAVELNSLKFPGDPRPEDVIS